MTHTRLELSRQHILNFRRQANGLDARWPPGAKSLRQAAWAGLQDSMPRAALLSLHARVAEVQSTFWEHKSLVQIWGPRFSAYVVAARDLPVFSLGRLSDNARSRARAHDTATRLHAFLDGRRMPFGEAGRGLRVHHNSLRYAAATGRVLIRWAGAQQPVIWTCAAPDMDPRKARLELARRYLHLFGPATAASFARWAGIQLSDAHSAFDALHSELMSVRTPLGDSHILALDETEFRAKPGPAAPARLLPSGDAYYLLWGTERKLLIPDAKERASLWTTRVWPGAVLVNGEISGVWRRAGGEVSIETWRRLSAVQRKAVEYEALSLPLPEVHGATTVRWS